MPHPNKLYLASLCAFQVGEDLLNPSNTLNRAEHLPVLLMAPTMDDAAMSLKLIALDTWKKQGGWSLHSATIQPFKKEFITSTLELVDQEIITLGDDPSEHQKFFNFDDRASGADIQNFDSPDAN